MPLGKKKKILIDMLDAGLSQMSNLYFFKNL